MSDKINIEELFQKELGNYKAKVDPNLWNGIQAGLGTAGAAGVATSVGLTSKIIIGASIVSALTVGSILWINNTSETPISNEKSKVETTIQDNPKSRPPESEKEFVAVDDNKTPADDSKVVEEKDKVKEKSKESNTIESPLKIAIKDSETPVNIPVVVPTKESNISSKTNNPTRESNLHSKEEIGSTHKDEKTNIISALSKVKIEISEQKNQYVSFNASNVPKGAEVRWNFGDGDFGNSSQPDHFYSETGEYRVDLSVSLGDKKVIETTHISIQIDGEIGTLPNIFTPNGDGSNDVFFIESKHLKTFQLTIMDKNQNVIYSTNNPQFKWDGRDKYDQPVKDGNYIYIIVAEDESGNTINKYQQLTIQR